MVQAAIVAIMVLHTLTRHVLEGQDLDGVPTPLTSSLMLFPVLYAAVEFGTTGAVATSMWATTLLAFHWTTLEDGAISSEHLSIELVGMVVLAASGVVVGRHVERERQIRLRLEGTLRRLAITETRYRDLFDHQPSPVVVTDGAGAIVELNTAADRLLGSDVLGTPLLEVLGSQPEDFVGKDAVRSVAGADGQIRRYLIEAHPVDALAGGGQMQVVLADVTEQHHRLEFQRALTASCLAAQEEERVRLARELHDDPLQQLTYLVRLLDDDRPAGAEPPVREAHRIAASASAALRQLIRGLRPPVLDDLGLVPALRQLATQVQDGTGLPVEVRAGVGSVRAAPDVELAAYRIAQEALANVVKHAYASRATLDVHLGDELVLTVSDNGAGFVPRKRMTGMGLAGIRERALLAGGSVSVQSVVGAGTTIRLALPVDGPKPEDPSKVPPVTDLTPAWRGFHAGRNTRGQDPPQR